MKNITLFIIIICSLSIMINCGGSDQKSDSLSEVTISATFIKSDSSLLHTSTVERIRYIVSGPGMNIITGTIPVQGDLVEFVLNVPNGPLRHFLIEALDINQQVRYSGEAYRDLDGTPITIEILLVPTDVISTECLNAVNHGNIFEARDMCVAAANSYGSIVSNDADLARFFAALSRVAVLWYDQASDGDPNNGLNTLGDILDAFGCSVSGRDPEQPYFECPEILPPTTPTGGELQTFIKNIIRPEIEGAIENLNNISQEFNIDWVIEETYVESDFGDVLTLRAVFKTLLASIIIENSYNLDVDFALLDTYTKEQFLSNNSNFLTVSDCSELSSARTYLNEASNDILLAIDWILSETDDQNDDFINLLDVALDVIDDAKSDINNFKKSLSVPVNVYHEETQELIGTINFNNFFLCMDLRSLLPSYSGDIPGYFPDPTFNSIWTNYTSGAYGDPNRDLNEDGIPDVLNVL